MPDRDEKQSISSSHYTNAKWQSFLAALESLKSLNTSTFTFKELSSQITARIRPVLKAQGIALWLADDLRTTISLRAYSCIDHIDILPKNFFYSLDKPSNIADCLQKNKASLHKKYSLAENDPRIVVLSKDLCGVLLPLRTSNGAFGVLEILSATDSLIEKADLELLEILATQIALLLSNQQNIERLSYQSALQKQLYEITVKINQAKDYKSILQLAVEELCTTLNLPSASMHVKMVSSVNQTASAKEHGS